MRPETNSAPHNMKCAKRFKPDRAGLGFGNLAALLPGFGRCVSLADKWEGCR